MMQPHATKGLLPAVTVGTTERLSAVAQMYGISPDRLRLVHFAYPDDLASMEATAAFDQEKPDLWDELVSPWVKEALFLPILQAKGIGWSRQDVLWLMVKKLQELQHPSNRNLARQPGRAVLLVKDLIRLGTQRHLDDDMARKCGLEKAVPGLESQIAASAAAYEELSGQFQEVTAVAAHNGKLSQELRDQIVADAADTALGREGRESRKRGRATQEANRRKQWAHWQELADGLKERDQTIGWASREVRALLSREVTNDETNLPDERTIRDRINYP
jgi:hypothetical protein